MDQLHDSYHSKRDITITSKIHIYITYLQKSTLHHCQWIQLGELDLENHTSQHHNCEMGGSCEPTGHKVHTILCAISNQNNI